MWWALVALASAGECENPEWVANATDELIVNFMLSEATASLSRAEAALACSGPASPTLLARLMNAEGTIALLQGNVPGATLSYAAGRRLDASAWKGMYGADAEAVWLAAAVEGAGKIELTGVSGPTESYVDGVLTQFPAEVVAGRHLVQVGREGAGISSAKWMTVAAGETAMLRPVLAPVAGATTATAEVVQAGPTPEQLALIRQAVAEALAAQAAATAATSTTTTPPIKTKPPAGPPKEHHARPAIALGLLTAGVGAVAVGATFLASKAVPYPTDAQRNQLIIANVVGWSLGGVGLGVTTIGLITGPRAAHEPVIGLTTRF